MTNIDYQAIVEHLSEGVVILGMDTSLPIQYANPSFCNAAKSPLEVLVGSSFLDLLPQSKRVATANYLQKIGVENNSPPILDLTILGNVSEIFYEAKPTQIIQGESDAILMTLTDVTERRRVNRRLRQVLDSMEDVVLSFSYSRANADLNDPQAFFDSALVEVNAAAEGLYGTSRSDLLKGRSSVFTFIHPDDKEKVFEFYSEVVSKGFGSIDYRIMQGGRIKFVTDSAKTEYVEGQNGKIRRVNHFLKDTTKARRDLALMREKNEKFRQLFERSNDMIYEVNPDGSFIDLNPAGRKMLGVKTREDALHLGMPQFYVDINDRERILAELEFSGKAVKRRVRFKKLDGTPFEGDISVFARKGDSGVVLSYQGIIHDISETLRSKELETLEHVTGMVADDLMSVMSNIMFGVADLRDSSSKLSQALHLDNTIEALSSVGTVLAACNEVETDYNETIRRLVEIRNMYHELRRVSAGTSDGSEVFERITKFMEQNPVPVKKPKN